MKKVLIVVDMQEDFIRGPLGSPEAQAIIPAVRAKIDEYITRGDRIIYTADTHDAQYSATHEGKCLPIPHCISGSEGWKIIKELDRGWKIIKGVDRGEYENDLLVFKSSFGYPFWEGMFDDETEIELVGVCTDICVISNALILRMLYPEAEITVDANCCAGATPQKHEAALDVMESCHINIINR